MNLRTKDGLTLFLGREFTWAETAISAFGQVRPHAMVFGTTDDETGQPIPSDGPFGGVAPIPVMPLSFPKGWQRPFAEMVRRSIQESKAIGYIVTFEAWGKVIDGEKEPTKFAEHVRRIQTGERMPSISTDPERTSCVCVSLEHLAMPPGTHTWIAVVEEQIDGAKLLGKFEYLNPAARVHTGNNVFGGLLKREAAN